MAVLFHSQDRVAIECETPDSFSDDSQYDTGNIGTIFEVERCCRWIREYKLAKVALQFPDSLLKYSPEVSQCLELELGFRVYILGDTSYGECCVDEVAAEHIGCDGIIHFGRTCLTPTQKLKVLYIFTRISINDDDFLSQTKSMPDGTALFYDVQYHYRLTSTMFDRFNRCVPMEPDANNPEILCGRHYVTTDNSINSILYVGTSESYQNLLSMTFPDKPIWIYNPILKTFTSSSDPKLLMKRYYVIEKAKDAERIGILVGTLGVSRYNDVIDRIRETVKKSGKRVYTFIVGKPNIAKLANFPEIDVFVLVACPESSVSIDSKEYLRPIITPLELDIALNQNREWDGKLNANFIHLLPGNALYKDFRPGNEDPDMSLVTGNIRYNLKLDGKEDNRSLIESETRISILHDRGGGEYLSSRSWKGLEQKLGETEVPDKIKEGRKGIAMNYDEEPSLPTNKGF